MRQDVRSESPGGVGDVPLLARNRCKPASSQDFILTCLSLSVIIVNNQRKPQLGLLLAIFHVLMEALG
jgi:hypothetical protein